MLRFIFLTLLVLSLKVQGQVLLNIRNNDQKVLIEESLKLLPSLVRESLEHNQIQFQIKRLNKNSLNTPCDNLPFIYGEYEKGIVTISEQLIERALTSGFESDDFTCKHRSYNKLLISTVLHESFHAYDLKKIKKERFEENNLFRSLGFFDLDKSKKNFNSYPMRSPNKYEYTNIREFLAVNFEYFLLDKSFQCRRPNLYKALSESLDVQPFSNESCLEQNREVSLSDTSINKIVKLDIERVREIHYLFASKGEAIMSRFGHSMFKIVLCDESLNLKDCRIKGDNIVIGFMAQNTDVKLNLLKGIFGKYSADIVVSDMETMKRQYNRSEFRDLESYPLQLTNVQKERFINHFLNLYWEYSGRYYFFSNNCADEAFRLLQVTYNRPFIYEKSVATPIGILKFLKKEKIIDETILNDKKSAVAQGLLYESFFEKLNEGFQFVYREFPKNFKEKKLIKVGTGDKNNREKEVVYRIDNIIKYSEQDVFKRRKIINEILATGPSKKTILGLLVAETHAHFVTSNKILNYVQNNISVDQLSGESLNIFKRIVDLKNLIVFGQNIEGSGYGIAQGNEIESVVTQDMLKAQEELQELSNFLKEIFEDLFEEEYKLIEESEFNKSIIKNYMRS